VSGAVGKASKKKAQRRHGSGQSRAGFGQERAAGRQERASLQASRAFSELGDVARSLEQTGAENVKAWWGGAPVVPATIPEWNAESLGHYFFSDSNIVKTAAAPPLAAAVIPEPEKLAADHGLLTGAVSALTRAVVFDGVKASDPALDPFLDLLTPAVEKELEYAAANNSYSDGPLYHFDVFPLFYATLAVVGHDDTLTALLPVLARHFDAALTGIGVTTLTGVQVTESLFRALLEDYRFEDPEDADLLARLKREKTHGTGLMQLVRGTLVAPEDAFRVGLAVLAELAELCRTNAKSILGT
jgi:hypothetical protein